MKAKGFSLDLSGTWSARQAKAVLKIVEPEAEAMGMQIQVIDITAFGQRPRVIFSVLCRKHQIPIATNSACEACLLE